MRLVLYDWIGHRNRLIKNTSWLQLKHIEIDRTVLFVWSSTAVFIGLTCINHWEENEKSSTELKQPFNQHRAFYIHYSGYFKHVWIQNQTALQATVEPWPRTWSNPSSTDTKAIATTSTGRYLDPDGDSTDLLKSDSHLLKCNRIHTRVICLSEIYRSMKLNIECDSI